MKFAVLSLSIMGCIAAFSAFASSSEESHYCSSEVVYADGNYRPQVRLECEDPRAGHCLIETKTKGQWDYEITSEDVCTKAATGDK